MAVGTTLTTLLAQLRAETSRSLTAGAGANEDAKLTQKLNRTQRVYYDDYDWPHLNVQRLITLAANKRFHPFPGDMDRDAVMEAHVRDGGIYRSLRRGIGVAQYAEYDSLGAAAACSLTITAGTLDIENNGITSITIDGNELLGGDVAHTGDHATTAAAVATEINDENTASGTNYKATSIGAVVTITAILGTAGDANDLTLTVTEAGDVETTADTVTAGQEDSETGPTVTHWDIVEDDATDAPAIEVWPVPALDDTLILSGKRAPGTLSTGSDTAVLDDHLLVLTVASEVLAREDKKDSEALASAAQRRYTQLKRTAQAGSGTVNMTGIQPVRLGSRVRVARN
jgi:hypothetical protein